MARRRPVAIQREFYARTAASYEADFGGREDEHNVAMTYIGALATGFGWTSALDVGAGTGRGVRHVIEHHPGMEVRGVEPVPEMIAEAERQGVPPGVIVEGVGERLPFDDDAFDVVFELGILHHVPDPAPVVAEMMRVARRAVFLSDANRFAGGSRLHQMAEFVLHRTGLWGIAFRLANRGRSYHLDPGDGGVVYSYSVYDSLPALDAWAARTFLLPTGETQAGWFHPLFGARTVLLAAIRDA